MQGPVRTRAKALAAQSDETSPIRALGRCRNLFPQPAPEMHQACLRGAPSLANEHCPGSAAGCRARRRAQQYSPGSSRPWLAHRAQISIQMRGSLLVLAPRPHRPLPRHPANAAPSPPPQQAPKLALGPLRPLHVSVSPSVPQISNLAPSWEVAATAQSSRPGSREMQAPPRVEQASWVASQVFLAAVKARSTL